MAKFCFTTILVDDMQEAFKFYADLLGFEVIKRDHYPHFVLLRQEDYPVALHQVEKRETATTQVVLGVTADDLQKRLDTLSAQGVRLAHTSPQKFFGDCYAGVYDPAGNMLELIQWDAGAWEQYTGAPAIAARKADV
jgi:catechol 2,3-dioxygenase-like lactoylglutathione lyase family enzyme